MTAGRPRKPTALKVLHGDRQDRIPTNEPRPAELPVVPPYELSAETQAVWDRLAPDRIAKGVLTHWDVDAFAAFAEVLVILRRAHEEPVGVWKNLVVMADKLGAQFGWTPAERARLNIGDHRPGADDDLLTDPARLLDPARYLS